MADVSFEPRGWPGLDALVARSLLESHDRIRALDLADGRRAWLKRVEDLSLRLRLQKGDSRKGFERDRAGLHALGEAGLPVAPILAEGPDYFVTPDLGVTLQTMLRDPASDPAERCAAFAAAGAALAALHANGFTHGRPSIRDICWDGEAARFIDLERFSPHRTGSEAAAMDVLIFVHSLFAVDRAARAELQAAMDSYRAAAPRGVWEAVQRKARGLRWLVPVTAPIRRLKPRSRDLNAVPLTIDYIGQA
jgi:tRNA A-37 threonylcarbamoyl transferase component Bud32